MVGIEQAFDDTERVAETARKSASNVVSQARALARAAQTGNVAGIKRCQENLQAAVTVLRQDVASVGSCWPFTNEEEKRLFDGQYAEELRAAAAERTVRADRKKGSTAGPSYSALGRGAGSTWRSNTTVRSFCTRR